VTRLAGIGRRAAIALGIAVAYYAGCRVGFLLTFSPLTPSVLWPSNAILTAALLLTPPRRWWLCLLAALPAHVAVYAGSPRPLALVLALFLTNCSEAVIAAGAVRRFGLTAPALFDSLRAVGIFIVCAGFVAPFVSSFLEAGAAAILAAQDYWLVWQTRFFANALTALTVVPALVLVAGKGLAWVRRGFDRQLSEAVLVWLGIVAVGLALFDGPRAVMGFIVLVAVPFALLLSLLVWAAVRLGPVATSLAVLTVEVLAIWGAARGQWPFDLLAPADSVVSLQIFLIGVAIPLLCLAALIEERQRDQEALKARLRFEEMLSRLSRAFVHLPSDEVDRTIDAWLRRLGEHLGSDHMAIFQLSTHDRTLTPTHAWIANGTAGPSGERPWLPALNGRLHDSPLMITDLGVISFGARRTGEPWPPPMIPQLRLVAEVFANAITRKQAESALRASEFIKTAVLGSLTSGVAVLDRLGRVVAINEAWHRLGHDSGTDPDGIGVGASCVEVCAHALAPGSAYAGEAQAAIEAVIAGTRADFALEYPRAAAGGERWFALSVLPLNRVEGGAVVSLTEITQRKRVELDAQRTRQELAHFTRVSTMGELTASLAHELSQPLTGILANAQAAQRLLAAAPPNLDEVRASLADIVADDRRAGDIIRRLRDLLKKGETRRVLLDLNALVGDVVKLVSSDALIRGVAITLEVDPALPLLRADRVQLQQVVLNLLMNAMDAVAGTAEAARVVVVRTRRLDGQAAQVSVEDWGPGIAEDTAARIFEPFYTTKSDGLGMGLSIARSIVEAHGGCLWATNNPTGGATFHFTVSRSGLEPAGGAAGRPRPPA
jgi:signal transduction histidine kinase/integral membrane sensor domain MASE1